MRKYNGKEYEEKAKHDYKELLEIISILRGKDGCEWDKAQTHESLMECLKNESEEVMQAVINKDDENLKEELGDVLLQILLNAEIASERGAFNMDDIIQVLSEKLIRRHPHVFGDAKKPKTIEENLALWKSVKQLEKQRKAEQSKNKKNI